MAVVGRVNGAAARSFPPQPHWDGLGFSGDQNVEITIGPADSRDVQDAAAASGVDIDVDAEGEVTVDRAPDDDVDLKVNFGANLAERMGEQALAMISADLYEGIEADERSRSQMLATYNDNIDMMAVKIEHAPGGDGQSISNFRHPVMLEATVRFQSAAGAEMLPASGPAKIRNDGGDTIELDEIAFAFEKDFNHYLTTVATEYYPDTDRALFYLAYGGCIFKKIYTCPVRRRPVSEAVYIPDLIVSNDCTDLQNALRVTHQLKYLKSEVTKMQRMGLWRDVPLTLPPSLPTPSDMKEAEVTGINPMTPRIQDARRIIWECYTELDLREHGMSGEKGQPRGLPIPYRVTLDKESRQVLEIRRDWSKGDELFRRKKHFVKFGLVPGFGFYDHGFLHLMGNQTKTLTAIWRILVDAGMFSNFPGGVMIEGARMKTNILRPNPGEFLTINTGPQQDIQKAFAPLPYKEPSTVLFQLAQAIEQSVKSVGIAAQLETGEGRTNIPVGTIMSQIEQQTQVMLSVHKRLHRAQAEELACLRELFAEDPTMLWKFFGRNKEPAKQWMVPDEFMNLNLVPASDPNVPSQIHRIMLATALTQLAQLGGPSVFDIQATAKRLLMMINVTNPDEILMTPAKQAALGQGGPPPPDPKVQAEQLRQQTKTIEAQMRAKEDQTDLLQEQMGATNKLREQQAEGAQRHLDRQSQERIQSMKEQTARLQHRGQEAQEGQRLGLDAEKQRHDMAMDHAGLQLDHAGLAQQEQESQREHALGHAGLQQQERTAQRQHSVDQAGLAQEAHSSQLQHDLDQAGLAQQERTAQRQHTVDQAGLAQQAEDSRQQRAVDKQSLMNDRLRAVATQPPGSTGQG